MFESPRLIRRSTGPPKQLQSEFGAVKTIVLKMRSGIAYSGEIQRFPPFYLTLKTKLGH